MKVPRLSRREFIAATLLAAPGAIFADLKWVEPTWLKVRHVRLAKGSPRHRFIQFSDIHHKGDTAYLKSVVKRINSLAPDFVCFTGDVIEQGRFLAEALEILSGVNSPMFGVPGNHDYWSNISFEPIHKCFNAAGGAWLVDEQRRLSPESKINLIGITCARANQAMVPLNPSLTNILLMHYPAWAKKLGGRKFDLMLAGHSHGGQVRIPFYGPIIVPYAVDEYNMGLYQTASGPLYVNPGIGYIGEYDFRFNCRPEITVIEI
ncbi:MAG: metallophosphoesterase [Verrucomicrobiota bacterium]